MNTNKNIFSHSILYDIIRYGITPEKRSFNMVTALLVVIFVAYIGLGIPDSLLGAAWPAIYADLGIPVSYASYITACTCIGTIISSFMSGRVIKALGTAKVALLSTALTAAALLGFSFSGNIIFFCLVALPLGLGAGSVDTALNNYVALNYKASHVNFLHCSYGVGVSLSPYLMSLALSDTGDWRRGYRIMFIIQSAIALLLLVTLPMWKKVKGNSEDADEGAVVLSMGEALRQSGAKSAIGMMMGSCAIESLCLVWAGTFLAQTRDMTAEAAARLVTVYFIGMTAGRFLSGLLSMKLPGKPIIFVGQLITLCALLMLVFDLPEYAITLALFLIGFGNGPLFPGMTHLTPRVFGKSISQSMIGVLMGFSYVSILLSPFFFGQIAEHIGTWLFPYYALAAYAIMMISTAIFMKKTKGKQ